MDFFEASWYFISQQHKLLLLFFSFKFPLWNNSHGFSLPSLFPLIHLFKCIPACPTNLILCPPFSLLRSLPMLNYFKKGEILIPLDQTSLSSRLEHLKAYSFHLSVMMTSQSSCIQNGSHALSLLCPLPACLIKSACIFSPFEWIIAWSI